MESAAAADPGFQNVETQRAGSALMAEVHFAVLAGDHVATALRRIPGEPLRLDPNITRAVGHLRDTYEHWQNSRSTLADPGKPNRALGKLAKMSADSYPWHYDFRNGFVVAGVLDLLASDADLTRVEVALLAADDWNGTAVVP